MLDILILNLLGPDLLLPILGTLFASGIIGAEREYRSSPAGFRTHILVGLSCALLMLSAVHQMRWLSDTPHEVIRIDPVRMAHGVLTGIGFLCGGVIFREGFSVRGLTTAASLWMTASLGILFGIGFYSLAVLGTITTVLILAAVRASERFLPHRRHALIKVRYLQPSSISAQKFRSRLGLAGFKVMSINQCMEGGILEFSSTISGHSEEKMEQLTSDLQEQPDVTGFEYSPHNT